MFAREFMSGHTQGSKQLKGAAKLDCISLVCPWPCGTILSALLKNKSQLLPPYSLHLVRDEMRFFWNKQRTCHSFC